MSSLGGLVPLSGSSSKNGGKNNEKSSITSLNDAPSFTKPSSSSMSTRSSKFTSNQNDSDDDLDALFDDVGKKTTQAGGSGSTAQSFTRKNTAPTQRKFKSTMKDLSDSEDNYNPFDDSMSSAGSPPAKTSSSSSPSPKVGSNIMQNVSFSNEDLDDSILGGLSGRSKDSTSAAKSATTQGTYKTSDVPESDDEYDEKGGNKSSYGSTKPPPSLPSSPETGNSGGGFIPSFLESGRQARARRQIPLKSNTEYDELDKALGIGIPAGDNMGPERQISDPFASSSGTSRPRAAPPTLNISSDEDEDNIPVGVKGRSTTPVVADTEVNTEAATSGKVSFNLPQLGSPSNKQSGDSSSPSLQQLSPSKQSSLSSSFSTRNNRLGLAIDVDGEKHGKSSAISPKSSSATGGFSRSPKNAEKRESGFRDRSASEDNSPTMSHKPSTTLSSPVDREKDRAIMSLQQQLQASSVEREAFERNLRLENESLRARLAITSDEFVAGGNSGSGKDIGGSDIQSKLMRELAEAKRTITQLEAEIRKERDESKFQSIRHQEEMKVAKERTQTLLVEAENRRESDLKNAEDRHDLSIEALKKLHRQEIEAIKERSKDNTALENLIMQLNSSTGSIRLIEEKLSIRHKSAELVKEGQLEARERLVSEMEEKAKDRVEAAETETYRLKGLLVHMEQMVNSLRSQTADEKERLRMESTRLQTMQNAIESERHALRFRIEEENTEIERKRQAVKNESLRVEEERRNNMKEIEKEKARLEENKNELAIRIATSTRSVEDSVAKLQEEERRLTKMRSDLHKERALFEQNRQAAMGELREAESRYKMMIVASDDLGKEKMQLETAAKEVQRASEELKQRDEELDRWEAELSKREVTLEKKMSEANKLSSDLNRRQAETEKLTSILSNQQLALVKMDHDVIQKTADFAQSRRETLNSQASKAMHNMSTSFPSDSVQITDHSVDDAEKDFSRSFLENFDENGKLKDTTRLDKLSRSFVPKDVSAIEEQLASARKSLLSARSTFASSNSYRNSSSVKRPFVNNYF